MRTYFISGHMTISFAEFHTHYAPAILEALKEIGDAPGVDQMAIDFLKNMNCNAVTVYHQYTFPRYNQGFPTQGEFKSDTSRDKAMTLASDTDIAWVRPGREKSGTARNIERRAKMLSKKSP